MPKLIIFTGWNDGTDKSLITALFAMWLARRGTKSIVVEGEVNSSSHKLYLSGKQAESSPYKGHYVARIDGNECIHCNLCMEICPNQAISNRSMTYSIIQSKCTGCGECGEECPVSCISLMQIGKGDFNYFNSSNGQLINSRIIGGIDEDIYVTGALICKALEYAENDSTKIVLIDVHVLEGNMSQLVMKLPGLKIFVSDHREYDSVLTMNRMMKRFSDSTLGKTSILFNFFSGENDLDFGEELNSSVINLGYVENLNILKFGFPESIKDEVLEKIQNTGLEDIFQRIIDEVLDIDEVNSSKFCSGGAILSSQ
jgi:ferredoxin